MLSTLTTTSPGREALTPSSHSLMMIAIGMYFTWWSGDSYRSLWIKTIFVSLFVSLFVSCNRPQQPDGSVYRFMELETLVWSDRAWRPMNEAEKQLKRADTKARVSKYVARYLNHINHPPDNYTLSGWTTFTSVSSPSLSKKPVRRSSIT